MRSLRAQLYVGIALAVTVSVALSLLVGAYLVRRSVKQQDLTALGRQADLIAAREKTSPVPIQQLQSLGFFTTTQQQQLTILEKPSAAALLPDQAGRDLLAGQGSQGEMTLHGDRFLFAARPAGRYEAVILLRRAKLEADDWSPFGLSFLVAGGVGVALAGLLAFVLGGAITRPIRRVAAATRRLAEGADPTPVPVRGAEELAQLAESFNHMAEELARARHAERTFLLSVSHELKTPLTAIRGHAEALSEEVMTPAEAGGVIQREAARLERLVRDLLDLARLNTHGRSFTVERSDLDLAEVVQETALRYEAQARVYDIELTASAGPGARAAGDHDRVLQVLSNLVENAIRITPPGGSVGLSAEGTRLVVADTGPGLDQEELGHAFDRFYLYDRYASERKVGTGLGLAIVKELTEAMGGRVEVTSALGVGTTFTVTLPDARARRAVAAPS
jgi:two-component system sensor histidine kinase BaeS